MIIMCEASDINVIKYFHFISRTLDLGLLRVEYFSMMSLLLILEVSDESAEVDLARLW